MAGTGLGLPPLEEIMAHDPDAAARAARRESERAKQEQIAAARVRVVDDLGRASATGKRKEAIARVWIVPGTGAIVINGKALDAYFPDLSWRVHVLYPFMVTGTLAAFDVAVTVRGGGPSGQAQAVRHGLAKALQAWEPELRPHLRAEGLLTRDSRVVERKKPGKAKARKSFQVRRGASSGAGRAVTALRLQRMHLPFGLLTVSRSALASSRAVGQALARCVELGSKEAGTRLLAAGQRLAFYSLCGSSAHARRCICQRVVCGRLRGGTRIRLRTWQICIFHHWEIFCSAQAGAIILRERAKYHVAKASALYMSMSAHAAGPASVTPAFCACLTRRWRSAAHTCAAAWRRATAPAPC
jgi:small subunit ribosomal protein S9